MTTEQTDKPDPKQAHIFAAIRAVMASVRGFAKTGEMKGAQSYNFQRYEDMAEKIGQLFRENGVMTQTQVLDKGHTQWDKITTSERYGDKSTKWSTAWAHVAFLFTSLEDGTSVHVEAMGEGVDSSDKAFNKAMTGAYKNALKIGFTLSTREDDPDDERPEITGQAVSRNDPWGKVTVAIENATKADVGKATPPTFTSEQMEKVRQAGANLPNASSVEDLEKVIEWAAYHGILEARGASGNTLAGAILAAKGMFTGSPQ